MIIYNIYNIYTIYIYMYILPKNNRMNDYSIAPWRFDNPARNIAPFLEEAIKPLH